MMYSRRNLIVAGTSAAALIGLKGVSAPGVLGWEAASSKADLSAGLKGICRVFHKGRLSAELAISYIQKAPFDDPRLDQFSIGFYAIRPVDLPEGTYDLVHPQLGHFQGFVQPAGYLDAADHDGRTYRLSFSKFKKGWAESAGSARAGASNGTDKIPV
jgi:hypothetical protein